MADAKPRMSVWDHLQYCDPRWLYLIFALMMVALEFFTLVIPVPVPHSVRTLYDRIERLPRDKIVIIDCSLDAGAIAEGRGQLEAVARHLFERNVPFAVFTNTTFYQGQLFATQILPPLAREMGKEYGKDYCIWGAVVLQSGAELQSLAKDIHSTVRTDINGTPLQDIPMMKNIRDIHDVSLVFRVSYEWEFIQWIGFIQSVYGTPFACGTAAISSSTAYTYLDSGQMCGLLPGAAGAAAYESLLNKPGSGTRVVMIQSFATLYVIIAILLGNVAMLFSRLQKARRKTPESTP